MEILSKNILVDGGRRLDDDKKLFFWTRLTFLIYYLPLIFNYQMV